MLTKRLQFMLFSLSMLIVVSVYGLSSPTLFQGKVLSPKGEPLEGAVVRINLNDELTTKTNQDGLFEWNNEKHPAFVIEAWHSEYPQYKAISNIESHVEPFALLVLKKTIEIKGRVTNKAREPIKNAKIYLETVVGAMSASSFGRVTTVVTDVEGNYLLKDLVSDRVYRIAIYADNYVRIVTEPFVASRKWLNSAFRELEWIQMEPGNRITFLITDKNGEPISGARLMSGGKDWSYSRGTTTDINGKAVLTDLPLGKVRIDVFNKYNQHNGDDYSITDPKEIVRIQWKK